MARSVLNAKAAKAAAARARMAKRSKRQRWMKENKKRLTIGILAFIALVFLAIFTPWGPDYYYGGIKLHLMETPTKISSKSLEKLYKLGTFYQYSLRSGAALEIYDEIGYLYFGVKLTEYGRTPTTAFEKRRDAEIRIKKGQIKGPPFTIPEEDIKYVALAVWRAGEIIKSENSKQFTYNIYNDLYLEELYQEYPNQMDRDVTEIVRGYVDRLKGRR